MHRSRLGNAGQFERVLATEASEPDAEPDLGVSGSSSSGRGSRRRGRRKFGEIAIKKFPPSAVAFPQWYTETAQAIVVAANRSDYKVLDWLSKAWRLDEFTAEYLSEWEGVGSPCYETG